MLKHMSDLEWRNNLYDVNLLELLEPNRHTHSSWKNARQVSNFPFVQFISFYVNASVLIYMNDKRVNSSCYTELSLKQVLISGLYFHIDLHDKPYKPWSIVAI